ncbi:hypothetical protein [Poseidonocella sp. HB161398]|uniref:hypothetical protein n=1 Tax=Poseidonocella sp. HB161398 TaxID=2320855 RepID=UPI001109AF19|nr:hypothetical protein [Poseidonocella sp. HB161398]
MSVLSPEFSPAGLASGLARPAAAPTAGSVLQYRGTAYRPADLPEAQVRSRRRLVYRGAAHCGAIPRAASAPAPGARRYRGTAY